MLSPSEGYSLTLLYHIAIVPISCRNQQDVSLITRTLSEMVKTVVHSDIVKEERGFITRERQRNCLNQCIQSITNCLRVAEEGLVDLEAEELRECLRALSRLTGDVDVEEILDIVFSEFCIGK